LLLAEVRDYTISGPRNPVVVCFTSPLPYLIAISSPPLFVVSGRIMVVKIFFK